MRRRNILLVMLAGAVVLAAIGVVGYTVYTRPSYPGLNGPVSVVCPGPPDPMSNWGGDGISPRNDCTPSFSQLDVRDFLAQGVNLGKIASFGQVASTRVVFLTIADLGRATGDSEWEANYPDDLLVCYAGLSGTFYSDGSPGGGSPPPSNAAYIVFDAHTGNELVFGGGAPLSTG